MITRFAPSPTGYIHIGNARTALICWLYARKKGGKLLLRIDDTDVQRSEERYVEAIKRDLAWLGVDWDFCFSQSSRIERYNDIFDSLVEQGAIYPCYETPEELEVKRSMMLKMGLPPIYDRSALKATKEEIQSFSGRKPYFRLKIDQSKEVTWEDEVRGRVTFRAQHISDPIIKRTDGTYTYMFPSVVDDIDYAVTHVVRGEDHVSNTATQICMLDILQAHVPVFSHLPLVHIGDSKISKRCEENKNAVCIDELRKSGVEAMAINSYLARIGTSLPVEPKKDLRALVETFDITTFNQAPMKFFLDDILRINNKILQGLSFAEVKERIASLGVECSEEFWHLVRENIDVLEDVKSWVDVCNAGITPAVDDKEKEFLILARDLLPAGDLNSDVCKVWLRQVQEKANRSTRDVMLSLRQAITGKTTGPGLAQLLPFIGKDEVVRRLGPRS
ncbi:glutamate--tRNA ligase [Candidatus Anaplasma sp. TIGMIC]|uniref:glutamate--tRNA ligase n=1 Tax=Candidatus Anaplasma sp. TIGMIC TaxID=3020713 RepID=UPI00232D6D8A|nr:glutamate--tRNA ligase [Candidatus Anaplasma sp. TIGMIC]MDB1135583.1 glutamate--tRNA ligase [Candidatus Anaplasma sp. TIGMIC]